MESNIFNELVIVKRSGQRVSFNGTKIALAIKKAFDSVYDEHNENNVNKVYNIVLKYIVDNYTDRKTITVEAIQDIIEYILKQEKYDEVYRSFSAYRLRRKASRELFDKKQQHKFIKATEKLILTVQDEEKPPLDLLFNLGETISNEFSKSYLIDYKYIRSHDEGNIFIHDLDYYALGATLSTHLDFSYINDYEYYFENIMSKMQSIKKEQCGEHTLTSIDYLFINWLIYEFKIQFKNTIFYSLELLGFTKYINIRKIEEIIDKLNTIYFDINIFEKCILSDNVKEIFIVSYKKALDDTEFKLKSNVKNLLLGLDIYDYKINNSSLYTISLGSNTAKEGLLISRVYLNVLQEIDRLNNVTTIFKLTNKKNPLLEYVCNLVVLNKNISFSYINASFNKKLLVEGQYKTEVEYFSDSKRILENIIDKNQLSVGRSVISKVSINLIRVAIESKSIKDFYSRLDDMLDFAKNELLQSYEYIASKYKKNYKYSFNDGIIDSDKLDDDKKIRKVIKNGTLNIGYVGLKETMMMLLNKNELAVEDFKLGIDIVKFIKEKCDTYTDEFKLNFVPFETTNTNILEYFESIDKSVYGNIKNVAESKYTPFYTIFDKMKIPMEDRFKIESKIQKHSSGGYFEIINIPKNSSYRRVVELVELIKEFDIGFFKIIVGKLE